MVRVAISYACAAGPVRVAYPLLRRLRPGHTLFVTVRLPDEVLTATLTETRPLWHQAAKPDALASVAQFFLLGLEHILIGTDHLLFLFALLLLPARLAEIVKIVTAFTVAHSITLTAAALGAVSLPGWVVEPAIALTIAYVGLENFFRHSSNRRWLLTFGLGLVHGFGFAGILAETNLPRDGQALSLLAFNTGVEIGQLAMVLLVMPALAVLRRPVVSGRARVAVIAGALVVATVLFRFEPVAGAGAFAFAVGIVASVRAWGYHRGAVQGGSAVVLLLGLTWFVLRLAELGRLA
jgi:hydrogenase/urease accessory protein HupE